MSSGPGGDGLSAGSRRALMVLIVVLAAVLRLVRLGHDGLWLDEATTATWASLPLRDLLHQTSLDVQAPGFYAFEHVIVRTLGDGEWQLRIVSALAGVALVTLVADTGRRLISPSVGLFAAFVAATSPLHVHYSREARNYALLALLALVAFRCCASLTLRPTASRAVVTGLAFAAILYTHSVGAFLLAGLVAAFVPVALRTQGIATALRTWGLVAAASLLAFTPQLPTWYRQATHGASIYTWAQSSWDRWFPWQVPASVAVLGPGAPPPTFNVVSSLPWPAWAGAAMLVLLVVAGARLRTTWAWPPAAGALATCVITPLVLLFLYSWTAAPLHVVGRVEVMVYPFAALLGSAGLLAAPQRARWGLLVAFAALALGPLRREILGGDRSAERSMVSALAASARAGDVVIVTGPLRHVVDYYLQRMQPGVDVTVFPEQLRAHPHWVDWSLESSRSLSAQADALVAGLRMRRAGGRAWLVLLQDGGNAVVASALDRSFRLEQARPVAPGWNLEVRSYVITPQELRRAP